MHFADYDEVDVSDGKVLYVSRTLAGLELAMNLGELDRTWQLFIPPDAAPGAIKKTHYDSSHVFCFETKVHKEGSWSTCFDAGSKLLFSDKKRISYETREFRFSNYRAFGGRKFPETISFAIDGAQSFEVRDINVANASFEEGHFAAPQGAKVFAYCPHPQPPKKVKDVSPEYPALARAGHVQGEVLLWGIIDTEGKLSVMRLISGHPILANSALEAARQWRYQPAMCPSGAVETGTRLKISFSIR